MFAPTPAALRLAGLTLAHALWNVSDLSAPELLCPLAFVTTGADQRLLRFEAGTHEAAVERARAEMAALTASADAWAFACEGTVRPPEPDAAPVDVVTIEYWGRGMATPALVVQRFARTDAIPVGQPKRFRLLAAPELVVDGWALTPLEATPALADLMAGVDSHGAVAPLWPLWQ